MKKGVVLLSGGIDSSVTFYLAKQWGYQITALIFDYRQRHKKEIILAKKIASLNKVKYYLEKTDLSWVPSSLTDKQIPVPVNRKAKGIPPTYVSARNIIFLSYAFSLAESIKAEAVFIGAHTQDYSGYPDCTPQFLRQFQKTANSGMQNKKIRILAPLLSKHKTAIIRLGLRLKVPFKYTWSCYQGGKVPCRRCESCRFRINAFEELGLTDPLLAG